MVKIVTHVTKKRTKKEEKIIIELRTGRVN